MAEVFAKLPREAPIGIFARWIKSALTAGWPCGWSEPTLDRSDPERPVIVWEALGRDVYLTPEEAHAIGGRLLTLAESVET